VKQHQIVSHYNLEAKIYKGKDGYHAIWHADGKRKKRQFKKLKDAKEAALKALKLIHKGQGKGKLKQVAKSLQAQPQESKVMSPEEHENISKMLKECQREMEAS